MWRPEVNVGISTLFLETVSCSDPDLTNSVRTSCLTGPKDPVSVYTVLGLPCLHVWLFLWVLGIWILVLMLVQQVLYCLSHLSSPTDVPKRHPNVGILLGTVGTRVTDRNTASTETIEQGDRGQACFPCCRIAPCWVLPREVKVQREEKVQHCLPSFQSANGARESNVSLWCPFLLWFSTRAPAWDFLTWNLCFLLKISHIQKSRKEEKSCDLVDTQTTFSWVLFSSFVLLLL